MSDRFDYSVLQAVDWIRASSHAFELLVKQVGIFKSGCIFVNRFVTIFITYLIEL